MNLPSWPPPDSLPPPLSAHTQLICKGQHRRPGYATPCLVCPVPYGPKGGLDGVGRPQVHPVLCREIAECQKRFL